MSIPFVDVQGLAGAWTLGTVQTGRFDLRHRVSLPGGFGDPVMDANRELVGDGWAQETGDRVGWTPQQGIGYVCGTPPCSGFSLLNTSKGKNSRGAGSAINSCMVDLVTYASKCTGLDGRRGPEIVSLESVQGAYSQGRTLMQELRGILEEETGSSYDITHVKMSGSAVGSAQMRHRYYPVFHRIPFYIERPTHKRVTTYADAIGDLVGGEIKREKQPYPGDPSAWAEDKRAEDGFDMHIVPGDTNAFTRMVGQLAPYWKAGEHIQLPVKRYHDEHGKFPSTIREKAWDYKPDGTPTLKGWSWPRRTHPDRPGYVLTGAGILSFLHYSEDRMLSVRECSRLMGYPDTWDWSMAKSAMPASMLIGKCCPVQSGQWISNHVANALDGDIPSDDRGDVKHIGEREWLHDSTNLYKPWLKEQMASR